MNAYEKVYEVVKSIPRGKVATYGDVALRAEVRSPRFVGLALHRNPDPENIPCHRVVNAKGDLACGFAFGGKDVQKERLELEGVIIKNNRVNLGNYRWN